MVIDVLARGLQTAGHEVVLFASGDSTCPVSRRWAYRRSLGTEMSPEAELKHVEQAYESLVGEVDIIHDHTVLGPWRLLSKPVATPVVTTNHGQLNAKMASWYEPISRRLPLIAISHDQAASAAGVTARAVIHHGIDVSRFPVGAGEGGYVAFLGRMSPDKGAHRAIGAARAAGVPIRLAAKIWEGAERAFFREAVEPLLGPDAVFVGELGGQDKLEFLAAAAALLNPIRWPEPFGLVMIEALACGTPVISYLEGAAPEIITDGVNGFLCADEQSMAEAIGRAWLLDRSACRASVEERFSAKRMVRDHVRVYRQVIDEWHRAKDVGRRPAASKADVRDGAGITRQEITALESDLRSVELPAFWRAMTFGSSHAGARAHPGASGR
jgi:glycosyltransferase involved in cell wall biosynthesis